jgi:hypothetical protein
MPPRKPLDPLDFLMGLGATPPRVIVSSGLVSGGAARPEAAYVPGGAIQPVSPGGAAITAGGTISPFSGGTRPAGSGGPGATMQAGTFAQGNPLGQGPLRTGVFADVLPALRGPPADASVEYGAFGVPPVDPYAAPANSNLGDVINILGRIISEMCKQVAGLRDDLYNHAAITQGQAFALISAQLAGSHLFAQTDMTADPPQASAAPWQAYYNQSQGPVLIALRCEPVFISQPPNAVSIEDVILLCALDQTVVSDAAKAPVLFKSSGGMCQVIVPVNAKLFINCMASQPVTVTWRVIPLKGQQLLQQAGL